MTALAPCVTPAPPVETAHLLDEDDGRPVSGYRSGDPLPGGALAWERLGVGHRCETWLAWSAALWSPVVVKFPRPDQVAHPRARASLRREVAALAGNLHPALTRLYLDGTEAAVPHLVLEHVDGPALDDELEEHGALDDVETALLGVQLFSAVATVHRRDLVHVDIKPANVVLRDGRPTLLDFGSARPLGALQPAGLLIGSPGYAAPELEAGEPIHPSMDGYGIGLTLWEARTARIAFDPDLPAAARPGLEPVADSALGDLIARLTAPDPRARPGVRAALEALSRIADPAGRATWPAFARN